MKRPLAKFCGAFVVASFIASVLCTVIGTRQAICICLSVLACFAAAAFADKKRRMSMVVAGIGVFVAFAVFFSGNYAVQKNVMTLAGEKHDFYARVTDTDEVCVLSADGKRTLPFRMTLYDTSLTHIGDYVEFTASPERTEISGSGYTYGLYQISKGAYLSAEEVKPEKTGENKIFRFAADLKEGIRNRYYSMLSADAAGKTAGIILGEKSGMRLMDREVYSAAGISHLFAVSGLHLAIIIGFVNFVLKCFYAPKRLRGVFCALTALAVMFITGFSASVTRAGIMAVIFCLSFFADRQTDTVTSLLFSGAAICCLRPYAVLDCSFMLSFSAVLSLIILAPSFTDFLRGCFSKIGLRGRITARICDILGVSYSIVLFTAPVIAVCFGSSAIGAPLGNLLISWSIGPTVVLAVIFAACPVKPAAFLLEWLIRYLGFAAELTASLMKYRMSAFITVIISLSAIAVYLIYLIDRRRHRNRYMLLFSLAFAAIIAVGCATADRADRTFSQLYVGNGDCNVFISGNEAVVVDCGGSSSSVKTLMEYLARNGIYKISDFVVTGDCTDKQTEQTIKENVDIDRIHSFRDSVPEAFERGEISFEFFGDFAGRPVSVLVTADGTSAYIPAADNPSADRIALISMRESPNILMSADRVNWNEQTLVRLGCTAALYNSSKLYGIPETRYTQTLGGLFKNNFLTTGEYGTIRVITDGESYRIDTERNG